MEKQLQQLIEFHSSFRAPYLTDPQIPGAARCELRIKLIQEELDELKQAIDDKNMVEVMDALTDIQYVLFGTVIEFGLQDRFQAMFDEVHNSNMSKLDDNGEPIHREDGKVLKSKNWYPPNLKQFLEEKETVG